MQLQEIRQLVSQDMAKVNQHITTHLHPEIELINELGHYIIDSGGKRLRPLLVLLSANAFQYIGDHHIRLAAIVEFIHTATLLHDDVVDASLLRRGNETANAIWGDQSSVLVGDYLFSRSFQLMVEVKSLRVMELLANASNTIAAGEVQQLINCHDPDTTEERYYQVITDKTAKLFSAASELGALISQQSEVTIQAMADYGLSIGIAFQLMDDILDYKGDPKAMGKNIGDDLAEGKPTLPLIHALKNADAKTKTIIRNAIIKGDIENMPAIQAAINDTKAIEYTYLAAKNYVNNAINCLSVLKESPYKKALIALANLSIDRCD
ncbi:MAG: octaprenyl diphosphate synthase [Legionellales bacterium]|nr:octaprenyl diphosphate synthase [Legionellales bacterium]|tara:strand:- start:1010 stop:1978 length:969 start_codon:yes stop_codon:yes gene_type:complete